MTRAFRISGLLMLIGVLMVLPLTAGCDDEEESVLPTETVEDPTLDTEPGEADDVEIEPNTITMADLSYNPPDIVIDQGGEVRWVNEDDVEHTVTADDGSFDSGTLAPGETFVHMFDDPGTHRYHCEIHPDQMTGTVQVQP